MRVDAARLAADGKMEESARRVVAAVDFARQMIEEPAPLFHHIIGENLLRQSCELAAALASKLSDRGRADVLAAIKRLNADDPDGLQRAWNRNREQSLEFISRQLRGDTVGFELQKQLAVTAAMEELAKSMFDSMAHGGDGKLSPATLQKLLRENVERVLKGHDLDELKELAARAKALGDELAAKWNDVAADEAFKKADAEVDSDESCLLSVALPAPKLIHRNSLKTRAQVAKAMEACQPR